MFYDVICIWELIIFLISEVDNYIIVVLEYGIDFFLFLLLSFNMGYIFFEFYINEL